MKYFGELEEAYPVIKACMGGEAFEKEHWKVGRNRSRDRFGILKLQILFSLIGLPRDTKLENLMVSAIIGNCRSILENESAIRNLAARAVGEITLREAISELTSWFEATPLEVSEYRTCDGESIFIIGEWQELLSGLSEQQSLCASLKDSKFFGPFRDQAERVEEKLNALDEILHVFNKVGKGLMKYGMISVRVCVGFPRLSS